MEIPNLGPSTIWSLDNHVSVVDEIEISVRFHFRHNEEISFDVKSEIFIEFSLLWFTLPFISVNNIPLLVDSTVLVMNLNVSVLLVNVSDNFKYLSSFVYNVSTSISEYLPPS
jgi:hypothetical protein